MVRGGLKAHVTCVDSEQIDARFVGRTYDAAFLRDFPVTADPCGENGKFHIFACEGPMFSAPLAITPGEIVERGRFIFADVMPRNGGDTGHEVASQVTI